MTSDRFQELHGDAYQELKDNTADDFADGWEWINIKWTDESKRLQFGYFDDVNFVGMIFWHEHDSCWIVVLTSDVDDNDDDGRYGLYVESEDFEAYEDALSYVVELTEEYP
jgi:hypothetical protein